MTRLAAKALRPLTAVCLAMLLGLPVMAQTAPPPRPVVSEIVTADPTRQRSFPGVIEAEVTTVLAFQTLGRLATLSVAPGDTVRAGEVVAVLDQVTLDEDLTAARAAVAAAGAQAELAAQSLARAQELQRRGVAATAQLERAQAARDTTGARLTAARADLARAEDAARFGTLLAPMDGIVLATPAEAGSVVSPGTPVVQLAGLTGREAVIDVPAAYVALLPPDASFTVQSPTSGLEPLTARLRLIEPQAGASLQTRRLRLSLGAVPPGWRLGALVTATLADAGASVITLPEAALFGPPEAPQVWQVTETRALRAVPVETGARLGERVVITRGLAAGQEIVVRGAASLTEGQIVGERVE